MKHGIIFKKWSNCGVTCKILWDDISWLYRLSLETGTNTQSAHPSRHCFLSIYWLPARHSQPFSGCFYFRTSKSHRQEIVYGLSPIVVEFGCTAERIQELGMWGRVKAWNLQGPFGSHLFLNLFYRIRGGVAHCTTWPPGSDTAHCGVLPAARNLSQASHNFHG